MFGCSKLPLVILGFLVLPRRKRSPFTDTISTVLRLAGRPMPIPEILVAAEGSFEAPLSAKQIKAALSAGTFGKSPRFRRVRRGVYGGHLTSGGRYITEHGPDREAGQCE